MRPSDASLCPSHIVESLERYRDQGIPPDDFLFACLCNDLQEAIKRADSSNFEALPHIVAWLYSEMPSILCLSRDAVLKHIAAMQRDRTEKGVVRP